MLSKTEGRNAITPQETPCDLLHQYDIRREGKTQGTQRDICRARGVCRRHGAEWRKVIHQKISVSCAGM